MSFNTESRAYYVGEGRSAIARPPIVGMHVDDKTAVLHMAHANVEEARKPLFNPDDPEVTGRFSRAFEAAPALWQPEQSDASRHVIVEAPQTTVSYLEELKAVAQGGSMRPQVAAYAKLALRFYGDEAPFRSDDAAWQQTFVPSRAVRLLSRLHLKPPAEPLVDETNRPQLELFELVVDKQFRGRGLGLVAVHAALWTADAEATLYGQVTANSAKLGAYERFGMQPTGRMALEKSTGRRVLQLAGRVGDVKVAVKAALQREGITYPA